MLHDLARGILSYLQVIVIQSSYVLGIMGITQGMFQALKNISLSFFSEAIFFILFYFYVLFAVLF